VLTLKPASKPEGEGLTFWLDAAGLTLDRVQALVAHEPADDLWPEPFTSTLAGR
jgi:hypothetical protein